MTVTPPGGSATEGTVLAAELAGHDARVIMGRNVLAHAKFVYTGWAGQCVISF